MPSTTPSSTSTTLMPESQQLRHGDEAANPEDLEGRDANRWFRITLICLPAIALVIAGIVLWMDSRARAEARREEAQIATERLLEEAEHALGEKSVQDAAEKLRIYISRENASNRTKAEKLLAEIDIVTSDNEASSVLEGMEELEFQQFRESHYYRDDRISHPVLVEEWESQLVRTMPRAEKKREEAKARRLLQEAESARLAQQAEAQRRAEKALADRRARQMDEEQAAREKRKEEEAMTAKGLVFYNGEWITEERLMVVACEEGIRRYKIGAMNCEHVIWDMKYDVKKSDSLISPYVATLSYWSCKESLKDNPYAPEEHLDTLGWQNGRWVVTGRQYRAPGFGASSKLFYFREAKTEYSPELFSAQEKAFEAAKSASTAPTP